MNAELIRERLLRHATFGVPITDDRDKFRRNFSRRIPQTVCPVTGILFNVTEIQMIGIHTLAVVALVQDPLTVWYLANIQQIRDAMRLRLLPVKPELPISVTMER